MSDTAHIILSWGTVGGTEKRLSGLFLALVAAGEDVRLVAARELVETLEGTVEHGALTRYRDRIDTFVAGKNPVPPLRRALRAVFERSPNAVYHYGLVSPLRLHSAPTRKTLYTIPNASLAQYNARGMLEVYGGILRSTRVDVLDPEVYRQLTGRFPWRRGSFSLTPGSYVDLDLYRPRPAAEKEELIVFAGHLTAEKQAPRLAACLPELLRQLDRRGATNAKVWIMGREAHGGDVIARVEALGSDRVRAWEERDPKNVFARAKVFLSLQRSTNHPSKSLLEAMACGAAPVVTDTRDSRQSAPDRLATYVPVDFTAEQLADACAPYLLRSQAEADDHTRSMREFLAGRHSLAAMSAYYRELYEQLRALAR